jgi:hypothetical protein
MVSGPGVTTSVKPFDPVVFTLSVTVTVNEYDPTVVAVPLSAPFDAKLVPGGADPVKLKVKGGTPPLAANITATEEPTCVLPNGPVVMISGPATIVTENVAEPLSPAVSAAFTVKLNVPGVVGVPCISPTVVTFNPGGTAPEALKV